MGASKMTIKPAHKRLLIVDDDSGIRDQLKWSFDDFDVYTADNRTNAIAQIEALHPPVVTLDLGLPPDAEGESEGFAFLNQIMQLAPETRVVVVSGSGTPDNAKNCISFRCIWIIIQNLFRSGS